MEALPGLPRSLLRAKTRDVPTQSVDFMVLQFSCVDSSVLPSLGQHHKESRWLIAVGADSTTLEVQLSVDKTIARRPEVGVKCNRTLVYPAAAHASGSRERAPLTEDFVYRLAFRGTVPGLKEEGRYEVRPEHLCAERWYPATLVEQRGDLFAANVIVPDGGNRTKIAVYNEVRPENVREAARPNQRAELACRKTLVLVVPQWDPLHATFAVEDSGLINHLFARPTPPPPFTSAGKVLPRTTPSKVSLRVSDDGKEVTVSVGQRTLSHFFSREPRRVKQETHKKLKHAWTFQLGPFAEHCVFLEKRQASSKVYSLYVDGTVLAESSAEDFDCQEGWWVCEFRLIGQQVLEWDVPESDEKGNRLSLRGTIKRSTEYQCTCEVRCKEHPKELSEMSLCIDGRDFHELPVAQSPAEERITVTPQALLATYGLEAPRKCRLGVPADPKKDKSAASMFGFDSLLRCCGCDHSQAAQTEFKLRPGW